MPDSCPPLTVEELAEVERLHTEDIEADEAGLFITGRAVCTWCNGAWPCAPIRLATEVRRLRTVLERPFRDGIVKRGHGGIALRDLDALLGWLADDVR